jgi:hypothetical protein
VQGCVRVVCTGRSGVMSRRNAVDGLDERAKQGPYFRGGIAVPQGVGGLLHGTTDSTLDGEYAAKVMTKRNMYKRHVT